MKNFLVGKDLLPFSWVKCPKEWTITYILTIIYKDYITFTSNRVDYRSYASLQVTREIICYYYGKVSYIYMQKQSYIGKELHNLPQTNILVILQRIGSHSGANGGVPCFHFTCKALKSSAIYRQTNLI